MADVSRRCLPPLLTHAGNRPRLSDACTFADPFSLVSAWRKWRALHSQIAASRCSEWLDSGSGLFLPFMPTHTARSDNTDPRTPPGLGSGTRALLSLLLLLQATTSSSSSSSSTHSSPPRAPPPPSPGAPPTSFHPAHRPGAGAGPPPPFNTGMGPGLQSQPALTLRGRAGGAVERVGRELPERVIVCVLPAGTQVSDSGSRIRDKYVFAQTFSLEHFVALVSTLEK